jgi:predicted transposase/invertase (TIGR01784 family)
MIAKNELPTSRIWDQITKKGREQGRQEGEHHKAIQVAENCIKEGLSIEITSKITNLSIAEVKSIAKRLGG